MSEYKPFDKGFTITPHQITAQLARLRELIKKRDEVEQQVWVDTVDPNDDTEGEK